MTNRSNESEQQQLYIVPKEDKIAFVNPEIFSHIGTIFFGKKKIKILMFLSVILIKTLSTILVDYLVSICYALASKPYSQECKNHTS